MRNVFKIIGLSFITASFAFGLYLTTTLYGQTRYEQGQKDGARNYHNYLNKEFEKQQLDKCRKT